MIELDLLEISLDCLRVPPFFTSFYKAKRANHPWEVLDIVINNIDDEEFLEEVLNDFTKTASKETQNKDEMREAYNYSKIKKENNKPSPFVEMVNL